MVNHPDSQHFHLSNNLPDSLPLTVSAICTPASFDTSGDWHVNSGKELRRLRSNHVILIERMLRCHQPHDVLNHIPDNTDWRSKTFMLALKVERLMFKAAKTRADYLNEHTLNRRVKNLCRYLVCIRMRKNAMVENITKYC